MVGALLLVFGLQWLRKAILRAAGLKAMHDEAAIYEEEVQDLSAGLPSASAFDWMAFTVAFKGVFLEGLEVAFIVLTFGTNEGRFDVPIAGASVGLLLVVAAGLALHRPLAQVPENSIKFTVGLLLTSFGTFWAGEGLGVDWTLSDATIPLLAVLFAALSASLVLLLRPGATRISAEEGALG